MPTRALYRAAKILGAPSPYDALSLKVYYPALAPDSPEARNTGLVPADASAAPFPVVILLPGINVGPESYQWLAMELVESGLVVVTYAWIAEDLPGSISLTPGINLALLRPDSFGSGPTASALPALLTELDHLQAGGVLAGRLDLGRIILGGHSAGGTIALQNANPAWFPQVKAAFSYGGHTMASTLLGWPPATVLPLAPDCPLLLLGGTQDGVVAASSRRYEAEASPTLALERTFDEAVTGGHGHDFLLLLEGANHFTIAHPADRTTGRPFLDWPPTQPEDELRSLLAEIIRTFIHDLSVLTPAFAAARPHIAVFRQK